jgi:hypothetical protein
MYPAAVREQRAFFHHEEHEGREVSSSCSSCSSSFEKKLKKVRVVLDNLLRKKRESAGMSAKGLLRVSLPSFVCLRGWK